MSRLQSKQDIKAHTSKSGSDGLSPVWTLADLLPVIDAMPGLKEQARRVLKANTRTAGYIAAAAKRRKDGQAGSGSLRNDEVLATVPADPAWLNDHLYAYPAPLFGVTHHNRNLSISGLRRVMRHVDLLDPYTTSTRLPSDSEWSRLLKRLKDQVHCDTALATFGSWCHAKGVEPHAVSDRVLTRFEAFLRTRTIHGEIPRLIRLICKAWPKAATLLQADPGHALKPPARRETYSLPWSRFPTSFRADAAAFSRGLSKEGPLTPFRGNGLRDGLRPRTVKTRDYTLRLAASALVIVGRDVSTISSLSDLVEEQAFEQILMFFWQRRLMARANPEDVKAGRRLDAELGRTAQTASVAATLMVVARRHCKLAPKAIERLKVMAQDVQPRKQTQLSAKNRERLRQFDDPVTRAKLLHLPEKLMKLAEGKSARPLEAARLARIAAAIEMLLHVPLRNCNLSGLRIGVHLQYRGNGRISQIRHLVLQASETKNNADLEWSIGPELAGVLQTYIERFRPMLNITGGDYLFPAGFGQSGPLSNGAMAQHIVRVVAEEVRAVINPHLFRCLCARFILERSPEAIEDVRLMIGDNSLQTVLTSYNASQPVHAALRTDQNLARLRAESAPLVADLGKPRRKRGMV